jgi:hypothetical protein
MYAMQECSAQNGDVQPHSYTLLSRHVPVTGSFSLELSMRHLPGVQDHSCPSALDKLNWVDDL